MMRLSREVRFALTKDYGPEISNSWSGWPSTNKLVPHLALVSVVEGRPDEQSGYICNIKLIDDLIRNTITEKVIPKFDPGWSAEYLLREIYNASCKLRDIPNVKLFEQMLVVTPCLRFSINDEDFKMNVTQQFEFSASHRLHNPELSDDENRQLFGKCNNPNGHGHNYVVEVTLKRDLDQQMKGIDLPAFEARVKELVVDRLDHKHLNQDIEYFSNVNPSVENIAIAIWSWLEGQFGDDKLTNVRVYETPKTWADYQGNG